MEAQREEFKELWKLKVPSKAVVFAWRLLKDRLPTRDNLRKKQIDLQDYTCPFCRGVEESAAHLFFHCRKIIPVWWESLSWNLSKFNEALLGKWGWDFANNQHQLWARILMSKYGGWNALCYGRNRADFSPWWKDLRYVFQQHHRNNIFNNLRWKVGDGARIKF
ncbi:uncharacterized protein LOC114375786 [Glycine soja]|uniref:uncharacterized protein LOC114375786 n=1 Tax=Glycine soja TaxID=3848 RepID=UPI00103F3E0D|nr:uncharacterized protein LOC114375786 [Glycine soja]